MKKIIATTSVFLFVASAGVMAQTKMIAHRSHSGKNHTFNTSAHGNLGLRYDIEEKKKEPAAKKIKTDSVSTSKSNNGTVVKQKTTAAKADSLKKPVVIRKQKTTTKIKKTK